MNIAAELLDARDVQTFIVGGTIRGDSASIVGRSAEEMFEQFSADKVFLSGAGCDPDFGVSGANLDETMVNRAMLRIAREIILVADASKFSKRSMVRIAPFSEIDIVISDTGLRSEMQEKVRGLGLQPDPGLGGCGEQNGQRPFTKSSPVEPALGLSNGGTAELLDLSKLGFERCLRFQDNRPFLQRPSPFLSS